MDRFNAHAILSRVIAVILAVLLIGIILQLIGAILNPVLPDQMMHDVTSGFDMLYGIVSPAMAPIMAIVILLALCWIIVGKRR